MIARHENFKTKGYSSQYLVEAMHASVGTLMMVTQLFLALVLSSCSSQPVQPPQRDCEGIGQHVADMLRLQHQVAEPLLEELSSLVGGEMIEACEGQPFSAATRECVLAAQDIEALEACLPELAIPPPPMTLSCPSGTTQEGPHPIESGEDPEYARLRMRFGSGPAPRKWVAFCQKADAKHGPFLHLSVDGPRELLVSGGYDEGERHGPWRTLLNEKLLTLVEYQHGVLHGRSMTDEGEGEYVDGKRDGPWKHGSSHGRYLNGEKDGPWTEIDGPTRADGSYKKGMRSGEWSEMVGAQMKTRGSYKNGEMKGAWEFFAPTGELLVTIDYANDEPTTYDKVEAQWSTKGLLAQLILQTKGKSGEHYEWRPNKTLRVSGHYKGMVEDGVWTEWHDDGNLHRKQTWKDGELSGVSSLYYDDGSTQKSAEGNYIAGVREGLWKEWHRNGALWQEGRYKAGKRQGPMTEYHPNGSKWEQGVYEAGEKTGQWTTWDNAGKVLKRETL